MPCLCETMASRSLEAAELISRFSHRPRDLLESMIRIAYPPKPSSVRRNAPCSPIGILDRLPPELLLAVLNLLDFQTIARLACVSHHVKKAVESLPAYRELMYHAPEALAALSQTGLIGLFSAASLRAALRSERCCTCREYGAYLFLPTCERCCWECLMRHPLLALVTATRSRRIFGLSPWRTHQLPARLQRLPVFRSIPGDYGIGRHASPTSHELTSYKSMQEVALFIFKSQKNIERRLSSFSKTDHATAMERQLGTAPYHYNADALLLRSIRRRQIHL